MKRTHRPPRTQNAGTPFQLPPEITVSKQTLADGWAYMFRHQTLGELGRILVQNRRDGNTQITCEVIGDPADPMTAKRAAIFKPLGVALSDRIAGASGTAQPATAVPPPPSPPDAKELVESKLMQCKRCDAGVALLIFAPEATDPGRFEDYARLMYPEYTRLDLPTWIIGPALGGGPLMDRPAEIWKVWPERGAIELLLPSQFNPVIADLAARHCALH